MFAKENIILFLMKRKTWSLEIKSMFREYISVLVGLLVRHWHSRYKRARGIKLMHPCRSISSVAREINRDHVCHGGAVPFEISFDLARYGDRVARDFSRHRKQRLTTFVLRKNNLPFICVIINRHYRERKREGTCANAIAKCNILCFHEGQIDRKENLFPWNWMCLIPQIGDYLKFLCLPLLLALNAYRKRARFFKKLNFTCLKLNFDLALAYNGYVNFANTKVRDVV